MKGEAGYWFALPRLLAGLTGRPVRTAEWSRGEAYGLGWLVFGIACVALGNLLFGFVRLEPLRGLLVLAIPLTIWIGCLLLYFLNWLLAGLLRRLGLYRARTNNPLQSFVIMSLTTLFALGLARTPELWQRSLGIFWLALLLLNGCAIVVLKFSKP